MLEGASETLRQRHIVWQLEVSPRHLRAAGCSVDECCALIGRHFDRFIDAHGDSLEDQSTDALQASLGYLTTGRRPFTDLPLYNGQP